MTSDGAGRCHDNNVIYGGTNHNNTTYKNMLIGVNGAEYDYSNGDLEMWENEDDSQDEMQEDKEEKDPLCPSIPITAEERKKLCRPWRKAIIIKLLGRRIRYKFLYGRHAKLWNLFENFEVIDLQNEFFLVRLYEISDYEHVLYDGPWMILGHYLTV